MHIYVHIYIYTYLQYTCIYICTHPTERFKGKTRDTFFLFATMLTVYPQEHPWSSLEVSSCTPELDDEHIRSNAPIFDRKKNPGFPVAFVFVSLDSIHWIYVYWCFIFHIFTCGAILTDCLWYLGLSMGDIHVFFWVRYPLSWFFAKPVCFSLVLVKSTTCFADLLYRCSFLACIYSNPLFVAGMTRLVWHHLIKYVGYIRISDCKVTHVSCWSPTLIFILDKHCFFCFPKHLHLCCKANIIKHMCSNMSDHHRFCVEFLCKSWSLQNIKQII